MTGDPDIIPAGSMLEVRDLTITYAAAGRTVIAVEDIAFTLQAHEILGVVGESGAGKSTLANGLMGLVDPPGRITAGKMRLNSRPVDIRDEAQMRALRGRHIGMIVQDTLAALDPLRTVGRHLTDTIAEHLRFDRRQGFDRAIDILHQVGIAEPEMRMAHYPHQLSGGMRQRLVIALAICAEPDVVVADEPTTNLDAPRKRQIIELIASLCRRRRMAVVLVSHDIGLIAGVADTVMVMRGGRLVEAGPAADVFGKPRHPYTRALIRAVPPARRKLRRLPVIDAADEGGRRSERADRAKAWLMRGSRFAKSCGPLVELHDVAMAFVVRRAWLASRRRYVRAVDGVSFDIRCGEAFGLVGESGSGKSTLARLLSGLQTPVSGQIRFAGADLYAALAARGGIGVRRQIQMIFQDPYSSLNARIRVADILAEPIDLHHLTASRAETRDVVDGLLEYVGLDATAARRYPHQFSAGQRQRIAIARALATQPRLLICDEPTSALDVASQGQILNLIKDLQEDLGLSVLFISHDLAVVRQMCERVGVMRDGRLCEIADTETLFEHPRHDYTRELLSLLPEHDVPAA